MPPNEAAYRFLYLPAFDHPISVRLTLHADGTGSVVTRIGSGAGGYSPKKILSEQTRVLTKSDVAKLLAVLKIESFWDQPTEAPVTSPTPADSPEWVMEGRSEGRAGKYHAVDRSDGGSLRAIGAYMLTTIGKVGPNGQPAGISK